MAPRAASKRVTSKADEPPVAESPMPASAKPHKRTRKENIATEASELSHSKKRPKNLTGATVGDIGAGGGPVYKAKSGNAVPSTDDNSKNPGAKFQAGDGDDITGGAGTKGASKPKPRTQVKSFGAGAAEPRDPPGPRYFLMKSEPEEFSLDDLAAKPEQTSHWEGVRNAQARNLMKSMKLGDLAFFYHSSCKVPAVVGVVRVVREAYPDHFAFDKGSKYFDPSSTQEAPKWWMVDVQLVSRMARPVTLAELRQEGERGPPLKDMVLINMSRLSVQPVTTEQWHRILELEQQGQREGGSKDHEEEAGTAKLKGKGEKGDRKFRETKDTNKGVAGGRRRNGK